MVRILCSETERSSCTYYPKEDKKARPHHLFQLLLSKGDLMTQIGILGQSPKCSSIKRKQAAATIFNKSDLIHRT